MITVVSNDADCCRHLRNNLPNTEFRTVCLATGDDSDGLAVPDGSICAVFCPDGSLFGSSDSCADCIAMARQAARDCK